MTALENIMLLGAITALLVVSVTGLIVVTRPDGLLPRDYDYTLAPLYQRDAMDRAKTLIHREAFDREVRKDMKAIREAGRQWPSAPIK